MIQDIVQSSEPVEVGDGHRNRDGASPITASQIVILLALLFALNLGLRLFSLRYDFVNGDEGVRALTALRWIEGARLYVDVVTDKPPGASFFYAAVFELFGRSMKAVHAAAAVWNYATSIVVYLTASRVTDRKTALGAAFLFVYFSTNYFTQDTMAANTELLMALPYTAAFYFFVVAIERSRTSLRGTTALLFAAGLMTGVAAIFKQVGAFNLLFFAAYEALVFRRAMKGGARGAEIRHAARLGATRLATVAFGLVSVLIAIVSWMAATGAVREFWHNAVLLNMFYIDSEAPGVWLRFLFKRGIGYVLFNLALWAPALHMTIALLRRSNATGSPEKVVNFAQIDPSRSGLRLVVLWGAVTLSAVALSGRFFGHYFIPALPALSILAAAGIRSLMIALSDPLRRRRCLYALGALVVLLAFGLVRFHHRTAILACETITGARTKWSQRWGMSKRQQEAEVVSSRVLERVAAGEPLYIWGYAHDVYWQTRCRPASRYLTPYYIDGRFPDAETVQANPKDKFWTEAHANLVEDLRRTRPRVILEVYSRMVELPYPEIANFINRNYREVANVGPDPARPFRMLELIGQDSN